MKRFEEVYSCDSVTLNVTNNCNLACTYCFEKSKSKVMMTTDTAIKAIDKTYRDTGKDREPFTINFFGGEPLLNWEAIKAVVDHCNEKSYRVRYGMTTNLTMLTDEMVKYIDDNSIALLVSVDGIKSIHDKNRCNSFDTVYKNMKRLIDEGLGIYIEARMTILPEDIEYAKDGVKMLFDMGIDNLCPMPVNDVPWSKEDIKKAKEFYLDMMKFFTDTMNDESNTRNISIKNCDDMMVNIMSPDQDDPVMCPIFENTWCTIDSYGDVYACHQGPTSVSKEKEYLRVGNLDFIDETKLTTIKKKATYPKNRCKGCKGRAICKCGCPTENLRSTGTYDAPSDAYCDLQIALAEAVLEYHEEILNASNLRNHMIVMLQENIKIKKYLDSMCDDISIDDKLQLYTRMSHVKEMITNIHDSLFPSFRWYIDEKLKYITALLLAKDNLTFAQVESYIDKKKGMVVNG